MGHSHCCLERFQRRARPIPTRWKHAYPSQTRSFVAMVFSWSALFVKFKRHHWGTCSGFTLIQICLRQTLAVVDNSIWHFHHLSSALGSCLGGNDQSTPTKDKFSCMIMICRRSVYSFFVPSVCNGPTQSNPSHNLLMNHAVVPPTLGFDIVFRKQRPLR
mmetsp:Transcript_16432/g.33151  ORF Transcript_16432/g.33151 Transcript_16432/m.33151 type:complete len:160 (-) Transcript_16432:164-643(-)